MSNIYQVFFHTSKSRRSYRSRTAFFAPLAEHDRHAEENDEHRDDREEETHRRQTATGDDPGMPHIPLEDRPSQHQEEKRKIAETQDSAPAYRSQRPQRAVSGYRRHHGQDSHRRQTEDEVRRPEVLEKSVPIALRVDYEKQEAIEQREKIPGQTEVFPIDHFAIEKIEIIAERRERQRIGEKHPARPGDAFAPSDKCQPLVEEQHIRHEKYECQRCDQRGATPHTPFQ